MIRKLFLWGLAMVASAFLLAPVMAFADTPAAVMPTLSLMTLISAGGVPALVTVALVSLAASAFCAITPTPAPGSRWAGLYNLVELLALITRHTKMTGIPAVDALTVAAAAVQEMHDKPGADEKPQEPTGPSLAGQAAKAGALFLMFGIAMWGLAACSSSQTQTAAKDAVTVAQAVQLACADLPPVEQAVNVDLKGGALNTAKGIEVYVDAVCQNPNQSGLNNTTAIWVGQMVGMLKALLPAVKTAVASS